MKKKLYALAAAGLIATAMSAGYFINQQNKSNDNYKVIDIEKITDAEFDFSSYEKNIVGGDIHVENGYFTSVGDKYFRLTVRYFNKDEYAAAVLIFDKSLEIVARIVFDYREYDRNGLEIESQITEKGGVIYYPENAIRFDVYKNVTGIKSPFFRENNKTKVMLSVDGGEYKQVNADSLFSMSHLEGNERNTDGWFFAHIAYQNIIDPKIGYFAQGTFFDTLGDCKENNNTDVLVCPKHKYELKKRNNTLFVKKNIVDFKFNHFANSASKSTILKEKNEFTGYRDWTTYIHPISKNGDVNFIVTSQNDFVKKIADGNNVNADGGAIVFNKKVVFPKPGSFMMSRFSELNECKYLSLTMKEGFKVDKINILNLCKLKSSWLSFLE